MNQLIKALLVFFIFSIFGNNIKASTFRKEGFKYLKEIKPEYKITKGKNIYARLTLDKEINKFSYGPDIVLSYGSEFLPSFIRKVKITQNDKGKAKIKILHKKKLKNKSISYTIKLPDLPDNMQYDGIILKKSGSYETGVKIYISSDALKWISQGRRTLYAYSKFNQYKNKVKFSSRNKKYLKLIFDKAYNYNFLYATYSGISKAKEIKTSLNKENFSIDIDNDTKSSVYFCANTDLRKISKLILSFKEKFYNRTMILKHQVSANRSFTKLLQVKLVSDSSFTKQIIDIPNPIQGAFKIIIKNQDDKSLKLKSIQVYSPVEELIFKLPAKYNPKSKFILYYGNSYIQAGKYELKKIFGMYNKTENIISFKALEHKINKDFSYSILEPPLSIWIIRILFYLGLISLAIPAVKIYRLYSLQINKWQEKKE